MGKIVKSQVVALFLLVDKINRKLIKYLKRTEKRNYFEFPETCQIPNLSTIYELFFGRQPGFLVEVGAYDGITYSNTSGLIEKGWQGILIEPIPDFYNATLARYGKNTKIKLVNKAVGEKSGELLLNLSGPLTSGSSKIQSEYENLEWAKKFLTNSSISVHVETLTKILDDLNVPQVFDVLVIDVEGFEKEVLAGFNWQKYSPRMVIIELADFHPDMTNQREINRKLSKEISSQGYEIVYKDYINTVFIEVSYLESLNR